jgi:hypothetical protein
VRLLSVIFVVLWRCDGAGNSGRPMSVIDGGLLVVKNDSVDETPYVLSMSIMSFLGSREQHAARKGQSMIAN